MNGPVGNDSPEIEISLRIIVKFRDEFQLPYQDGVEKLFTDSLLDRWKQLESQYSGITLNRLYTSVSPERILEMVEEAKKYVQVHADEILQPFNPPNFLTFYAIKVANEDMGNELIAALRDWDVVEYAYFESLPVKLPAQINQYHLNPPNHTRTAGNLNIGGIDVQAALDSGLPGCDGSGVSFIDIEKSWKLDHADLLDASGSPLVRQVPFNNVLHMHCDINDPDCRSHGTSVLGILSAQNYPAGATGIVPRATAKVLSAWVQTASGDFVWNLPDAVLAAANALQDGDVLLLETQLCQGCTAKMPTGGTMVPVEFDPAVFHKIQTMCTHRGITVIECAGNGSTDLKSRVDVNNCHIHAICTSEFRDSGAIIVGAATGRTSSSQAGSLRKLHRTSNYGKRVDCFAAGYGVNTAADNVSGYTVAFSGTSAAAAIVAGAAILVQAIARNTLTAPLTPYRVRALLKIGGTKALDNAGNESNEIIGVMPNMNAILANGIN